MNLTIVTVTWRSKEDILRLISSIKTYVKGLTYEIIVVDNNSQDGSIETLKNTYPEVICIENLTNNGYAKGMNQGLRIAKGEYVVCMNPDMELKEDCFTPLIEKLKSTRSIGLIAPQLRYADNSIQPTIKNDPDVFSQLLILTKLHHFVKTKTLKKYLAQNTDYSKEQSVEQLMGAFLLGSKTNWGKIGFWDEDYPLWWEDIQLCLDTRKNNFEVFYYPKTFIIHFEGKSFAQVLSLAKQKRFNYGMKVYFKKNGTTSQVLLVKIFSLLSLGLAYIVQISKIKPRTQSKLQ